MPDLPVDKSKTTFDYLPFNDKHYRDFKRKSIVRLLLTYLTPLIVLSIYFYYQYDTMVTDSRSLHLTATAENQSNTFDLFISERIVNLSNLINDPRFIFPPSTQDMQAYLQRLRKNSDAFTDIGYLNAEGIQVAYTGPFPALESQDYSTESWYIELMDSETDFIITDIYLGLRQRPHFTIAKKRTFEDGTVVLRTSLDPERMYEYITSLEGAHEVSTSIVNSSGQYQLVKPQVGNPLDSSPFIPPKSPEQGIAQAIVGANTVIYAYASLQNTDWALIVLPMVEPSAGFLSGYRLKILGLSAGLIAIITFMVFYRARQLVEAQKDADRTRAQLEHAAKLASIGELAAGIAHEINNPLAIINEEAGLMKDLMTAQFGPPPDTTEQLEHLENIREAVFRCRDVTRKLLGFVRKSDMDISPHFIHEMIDKVVDGILGKELEVSNIQIVRDYANDIPQMLTDANQLQQVLLNLLNNAIDALEDRPGTIAITTRYDKKKIQVSIADTGIGMTREQIEKIFLPFYTTKEVGKGTGLGLSVSYGIIKNMGGKIEAESTPGAGSTFTLTLPVHCKH
ncbi:MAG: ATP-binding protein [Candidatus Zixiibacteriota bacterium]